jgi:hypothetical protein
MSTREVLVQPERHTLEREVRQLKAVLDQLAATEPRTERFTELLLEAGERSEALEQHVLDLERQGRSQARQGVLGLLARIGGSAILSKIVEKALDWTDHDGS